MCKVIGVGSRSYYAWKNGSKPAGGSKVEVLEATLLPFLIIHVAEYNYLKQAQRIYNKSPRYWDHWCHQHVHYTESHTNLYEFLTDRADESTLL